MYQNRAIIEKYVKKQVKSAQSVTKICINPIKKQRIRQPERQKKKLPEIQGVLKARTGFEPVIRVLQTHALPLGYRAATQLLYKKMP